MYIHFHEKKKPEKKTNQPKRELFIETCRTFRFIRLLVNHSPYLSSSAKCRLMVYRQLDLHHETLVLRDLCRSRLHLHFEV